MAFGDTLGTFAGNAATITTANALSGSATVAQGDMVFVVFAEQTGLTATAVTDNLGNPYIPQNAGTDAGTSTGRAFYSRVILPGSLTTITVVASGSAHDFAGVAAAIAGPFASPIDANPANGADIASPFDCPATGTLGQADEYIFAWMTSPAPVGGGLSATSPLVLLQSANNSTTIKAVLGGYVVSATTTQTPQFTAGVDPVDATQGTASFKKYVSGIEIDSVSKSAESVSEASFSWTHSTTGSPKGAYVSVVNLSSQTNIVSSVTYGGTACPAVTSGAAADTSGEVCNTSTYFLGSSVPTGNQTVVVNRTNNTNRLRAFVVTVIGDHDTATTGVTLQQESQAPAEASIDDGSPGTNSLRVATACAGTTTAQPAGANSMMIFSASAVGASSLQSLGIATERAVGQGARSVGFSSASSDDWACVLLAIKELSDTTTPFNQEDWALPVGRGPAKITEPANLNETLLPTSRSTPFTNEVGPVVRPGKAVKAFDPPSLLESTLQPPAALPFRQTDWAHAPKLPPAKITEPANLNPSLLPTSNSTPFTNEEWPTPAKARQSAKGTDPANLLLALGLTVPFSQDDWANPQGRKASVQAIIIPDTVLVLLSAANPFKQSDWQRPQSQRRRAAEFSTPNLLENTLVPVVIRPFVNSDWQTPKARKINARAEGMFSPFAPTIPPPVEVCILPVYSIMRNVPVATVGAL